MPHTVSSAYGLINQLFADHVSTVDQLFTGRLAEHAAQILGAVERILPVPRSPNDSYRQVPDRNDQTGVAVVTKSSASEVPQPPSVRKQNTTPKESEITPRDTSKRLVQSANREDPSP